ncbi:hypothetical protein KCU65_g6515, partial [Aureobasidium melanogenum]
MGKNRCLLEKIKVFSVIPSGLDTDHAVYIRWWGRTDKLVDATSAQKDGKQTRGATRCLLEKTKTFNVIPSGIDIDWPAQLAVLDNAIYETAYTSSLGRKDSLASFRVFLDNNAIDNIYHNTAHLLHTQIESLHNHDDLLHPMYEDAYSSSLGKKDSLVSFRAFLINSATKHVYGDSEVPRSHFKRLLRIGEVLFWLQRAFGAGVFALLVEAKWKKLAYEA